MFKDGKLVYEANPSAQEFHESDAETKVLWGPMGSGKTSAALMEFVMQATESSVPLRGVVIRENYRQLQDSTLATWLEWFGDVQHYAPKHDKSVIPLPSKSGKVLKHELWFRACSRPEDASKFLSTEFSYVFMEECVPAFQHDGSMGSGLAKGVYDIVQLRLRQKGTHRLTVVCTFNPPFKKHWCHRLFLEQTPAELAKKSIFVKKQPPRENEKNLPAEYYDKIIERSDDPDIVRRFVYGEVVQAYDGVRVFPECRDGVHIVDEEIEPIKGIPLVLGWDFGRSPATLITQITPRGQWLWLRELQSLNSGLERHIELLRVMLNQFYSEHTIRNNFGDPSGAFGSQNDEQTCFTILTAHGFNIAGGEQDIQSRLESVKQQFYRTLDDGKPKILISRPNCQNAVEALTGAYRFPKSRDGTIGDKPIKNEASHLMDAAQYIATREFAITPNVKMAIDPFGRPLPPEITWNPLQRLRPLLRKSWMGR